MQTGLLRRHGDVALSASQIAEQSVDPYEETPKYAHGVVYFMAIAFGLTVIARLVQHLRENSRLSAVISKSQVYRRSSAVGRYLSSKQLRRLPVLGVSLLMFAFFLFTFTWTWGVRPYYRSAWNVGSSPLAMRSGMMALGCFPFIIAFAAKWNIISFITGVSHEKLQVYHQWMSHLFLFLSLVHTFPFVIQGMREIKPSSETFENVDNLTQLEWSWHVAHKVYYWSGTALLVLLAWLCWASLPVFRKRYYELFKWLHVVSALLFTAFFFVHCNKLLGSWDYLWATTAIFATSTACRFAWMLLCNSSGIPQATYEICPVNMLKLTIYVNPKESWAPGQHYFLNFTKCQPFQSHPFTIASISKPHRTGHQEMVVYIRRQAGVTKRLMDHCGGKNPHRSTPVLIDGPYGTPINLGMYDHVLFVAGGSGISFLIPLLRDLTCRMKHNPEVPCKSIHLIWSVREEEALEWMDAILDRALANAPKGSLQITLYVSGPKYAITPLEATPLEKSGSEKSSLYHPNKQVVFGRADVPAAVKNAAVVPAQTLGVAACGPESLLFDVRNTVAELQKGIVLGQIGPSEVFLHTEAFEW